MADAEGLGGAWVLGATLGLLAVERLAELVIHRRNSTILRSRGAVWVGRDGFGLILLTQILLFAFLAIESAFAPWSGVSWWTWPLLGVALVAQGIRYWVIATLGWRWSIRVVTVPGAARIVTGPYRYLPHPNYVVVAVETLVLPLAFGAWITLALVLPLNLVALRRRIALEERALRGDAQAA